MKEQAKILGWNTAIKVQNRQASQGLIGIAFENKKMAMVEVNCETDFVSKNESFKKIVELATTTCLKYPVLTSGQDTNRVRQAYLHNLHNLHNKGHNKGIAM